MSSTTTRLTTIRRVRALLPVLLCAALAVLAAVAPSSPTPATGGRTALADFHDRAPFGTLDSSYRMPGGMHIGGTAFDPDAPHDTVHVWTTVDRRYHSSYYANVPRADFGATHPIAGPNHGYSAFVTVPEGTHQVCWYAKNIGPGHDFLIRCVTALFDYGPIGGIDNVDQRAGQLHVRGWTMDGDSPSTALGVAVTVDGQVHQLTANLSRTDKATVWRTAGPNHGFEASFPVTEGTHTVCVTAHNIGYGTDNGLGCRTVVIRTTPLGLVDTAAQSAGKLHIRGWAFDPDAPTTALHIVYTVDHHAAYNVIANLQRTDVAAAHPEAGAMHGFDESLSLPEGAHTVCLWGINIGYGRYDLQLGCHTVTLTFTPTLVMTRLFSVPIGAVVSGYAFDPDTNNPINTQISLDGHLLRTIPANGAGPTYTGHRWETKMALTSGTHTVCAVGLNVLYGTHNSPSVCNQITVSLGPLGTFENLTRVANSTDLAISGWSFDPDLAHGADTVAVSLDGTAVANVQANGTRTDIGTRFPDFGNYHGFAATIPASAGEHTVCLTARNIGGGADANLGCKQVIATNPVAPSAPGNVQATPTWGGATVTWQAPASDGGAPVTSYVVTSTPDNKQVTVNGSTLTATIAGLRSNVSYTFTVAAANVGGTSATTTSPSVTTPNAPPPQTTPAPVSTSRYIRNISGSSPTEQATMRAEGYADAQANPSGHSYLILLDIGGQYGNGVLLSATTRFVTYTDLVRDINAYVDGYHSGQRASAPITIAIGTNNDVSVSSSSGRDWAVSVVNPVRAHAAGYSGMVVAGANDIEPGFNAGYSTTSSWLQGYLGATSALFVFNGSADGCAWTVTNRGCNNGWSMSGLYNLAAGAAPTRTVNLPQIYNTTMAAQWKYISLTGIGAGHPRINFGGPLTEWTACSQSGGCGSLTGHNAWSAMWSNLQSDSRLKVASLPYSTDLRVDR